MQHLGRVNFRASWRLYMSDSSTFAPANLQTMLAPDVTPKSHRDIGSNMGLSLKVRDWRGHSVWVQGLDGAWTRRGHVKGTDQWIGEGFGPMVSGGIGTLNIDFGLGCLYLGRGGCAGRKRRACCCGGVDEA